MSWVTYKMGDYYDVRDGTHDSPKYVEQGYPLITSKNLKNGKLDFDKVQYITKEDYESIAKRSGVKVGDVLLAMIGTIGNPVVVDVVQKFAIKNVALFKTNEQQSPDFLRYYLLSPLVEEQMKKDAKGTTQKFVGLGYLRNFTIKVPPLATQRKIVAKLDAIFAEIDKATAAAEANAKNAEALFQSYLTEVFERGGEGWIELLTSDVCLNITDGKHGDCIGEENSGYYFLSAKDVKNGVLNYLGAREITREDFEETHRRTNLECGDVLVTNSGTIGRMAIADDDERTQKTTFQKSVAILKPKSNVVDSKFLFHLLTSKLIHFNNISAGAAQKNLLLRDIRSLKIKIPKELSEQKTISNRFDLMREMVNKLKNLHKTKKIEITQLKHSILKQAFSGELVKE